jgi:transcriptional regulator
MSIDPELAWECWKAGKRFEELFCKLMSKVEKIAKEKGLKLAYIENELDQLGSKKGHFCIRAYKGKLPHEIFIVTGGEVRIRKAQ